ncbi:hypothetical protein Pmani_009643 [Petrolisthes manimaculis]|uniref:PPM-type phosphatase domain-containing protein n=1 Tax=Petrolisthes manimaculis TaxID=1843537 RepID=A0AAE1Q3U5_9EUCA|nr:hypothetical protein Pmani_009643 [Petrolisthes manimaculis]
MDRTADPPYPAPPRPTTPQEYPAGPLLSLSGQASRTVVGQAKSAAVGRRKGTTTTTSTTTTTTTITAASVDLSGRHLERLPSSLFSTLHLSSINLSHNLLTHSTTTQKLPHKEHNSSNSRRRRRGDRRHHLRRQIPHQEATTHPSGTKQLRDDERLSGDSGLPVEEAVHRGDPDGESQGVEGVTKRALTQRRHQRQEEGQECPTKTVPKWSSFEEELQAKLRLRRPNFNPQPVPLGLCSPASPSTHPEVRPRQVKPSFSSIRPWGEGGGQGGYGDTTSSSGVDETDESDSEEGVVCGGGGGRGGAATTRGSTRTLGALHHLRHFQQLQVVLLARNHLQEFPRCLLGLPRLACLSLAHNLLSDLPRALAVSRLVELDVSYNRVGGEVYAPPTLTHLRAAHNRINTTPTFPPTTALASLDLSGNRLQGVGGSLVGGRMKREGAVVVSAIGGGGGGGGERRTRRQQLQQQQQQQEDEEEEGEEDVDPHQPLTLNLRLNDLVGPVTLASIQNVTELDVSDNGITSLDVSSLACLTCLTCSNNALTSITLHAASLTTLTANNNRLSALDVRHHPRHLNKLNLARNELRSVPAWLVSSTEVTLVDVSNNLVTSLPAFLTSGHLRRLHTLSAHHNRLTAFPVPAPAPTPTPHNRKAPNNTPYHYSSDTPHNTRTPNSSYRYPETLHNRKAPNTSYHYPETPHNNNNKTLPHGSYYHHLHQAEGQYKEASLCSLEVLLLHNNRLTALAPNLFTWLNRLRVLNVSSNQLSVIPGLTEGRDGAGGGGEGTTHPTPEAPNVTLSLQELYAAANRLRDLTPLQYCRALRILHAPYNHITNLDDRLVWSWELLEELVLSGNRLECVPAGVSRLRRLRVLRVHSNPLTSLPRLAHLSALKVVDASHCQLGRVELEELVSPGLMALDISGNTALSLDHHQFTKCRSRRPVNVVDVTSRSGRSLPLTRPQANLSHHYRQNTTTTAGHQRNGINSHQRGTVDMKGASSCLPWSLGFAEVMGRDSKLTVGQLRVPDIGGLGSAGVAAVADGGQEVGSVGSLLSALPTLLQEELTCSHTHTYALKYALLTALRQLRSQGASLPSAVCAAHLDAGEGGRQWPVLRLCCYGPVSAAVTTTNGTPIVLTSTAVNTPPSGASECSEGTRCVLVEAPTLPDPRTIELHLGPQHTAVIIGSASLWEVIGPKEAAEICSQTKTPGSAAKHLLDLAQAYGARRAVSVIVVQLNPTLHLQDDTRHGQRVMGQAGELRGRGGGGGGGGLETHYPRRLMRTEEDEEEEEDDEQEKEVITTCRRVKFDRNIATDIISNKSHHTSFSERSQDTNIYSKIKNNRLQNNNFPQRSQSTPNVHDLDRSSPSGQSQSDYNELFPTSKKHGRTRARAQSIMTTSKQRSWQSIEDLYSYPVKKKDSGKNASTKVDPKVIHNSHNNNNNNNNNNLKKKTVTYYHYPRPDPTLLPPDHLTDHLLTMTQDTDGVLAPPAGFGDPGSDSEGSDSGLSGVSGGGQLHGDLQHQVSSSSTASSTSNGQEQVTEEQFRSWEYLLARNAKLLFMRELDTLKKRPAGITPTVSAPDLVLAAAAAENEPVSTHFQRNVVRKSRLGRGTFRLIQTKLSETTSKFNTFQKLKRSNSKSSNFRRYGSLQNLKYYQENRPRPPHYPLVQPDLATEMQERNSLDSLELETRMHHYWHTGVTNF